MVEKELIIPELNNEIIESMIYIIRCQKSNVRFWPGKNIWIILKNILLIKEMKIWGRDNMNLT